MTNEAGRKRRRNIQKPAAFVSKVGDHSTPGSKVQHESTPADCGTPGLGAAICASAKLMCA